jgi:hypothetical protein
VSFFNLTRKSTQVTLVYACIYFFLCIPLNSCMVLGAHMYNLACILVLLQRCARKSFRTDFIFIFYTFYIVYPTGSQVSRVPMIFGRFLANGRGELYCYPSLLYYCCTQRRITVPFRCMSFGATVTATVTRVSHRS